MYDSGHGIWLRSSASSDTGQVRENNEDSVFLWQDKRFTLAIVADGMGGAVAGEEASRIAVETIHERLFAEGVHEEAHYDSLTADVLSDLLRDVIRTANTNIMQRAAIAPELKGMGTTVTLALVRNTYAVIGHVGDSRAYLVDGHSGDISQITADHSFVEAMVAAGHISREEAEDHPMKNVLYRALGQSEDLDVDVYHSYLRVGDRLVLCSDGLTLHVRPEEIAKLTMSDDVPENVSSALIDMANRRGGRDNVSVVVIQVDRDKQVQARQVNEHPLEVEEDETVILLDRDRHPFASSETSSPHDRESQDDNTYTQHSSEHAEESPFRGESGPKPNSP